MSYQLIETGKLVLIAVGGVALGTSVDASTAHNTINSSTSVPLGAVVATLGVLLPGAWYAAGKVKSLEDKIENLSEAIKNLPCHTGNKCNNGGNNEVKFQSRKK